jgi:hypothetical protein
VGCSLALCQYPKGFQAQDLSGATTSANQAQPTSTLWISAGESSLISIPPRDRRQGACISTTQPGARRRHEAPCPGSRIPSERKFSQVAALPFTLLSCLPCSVFVPRTSAIPGNTTTRRDTFESGSKQVKRAFPQVVGFVRSALTTQGSTVRTRHRPQCEGPGQQGFS